ncbi:metalloregulator ArsR/SmtB family transcription factor [Massilia sp. PAMC28688]|uniref:ArsR/SmtB family transcription factor n=1 Tax=Massilia sp. PAMC28688 TaxID=2861283 RepID=UPI001C629554|nr:metalloregulator ArsR/SmtB family transcription factor [Massilia sp. PAMC28688]QYF93264.1 metalloregulator ArsR/SmtB family transcription factor [Massilia sp. PAMC28688]
MTLPQNINLVELHQAAGQACRLMKVLSNPDRLLLLCQMTQGELSVGALEAATGIRQPTLSQQLTVLREEQLVSSRREGKQIFYTIANPEAMSVLQLLYQLYCPAHEEPGMRSSP